MNTQLQTFKSYEEVCDRVKSAIVEALMLKDDSNISLESRYAEDLNAASLDMVTLMMLLEDIFGEDIPEDQAREIKTVKQTVDLIAQRVLPSGSC